MSIRTKLISIFLSLALIPLIFVSVVTFRNYKDSLQATRLSQLKNLADIKVERIEEYFSGLRSSIEVIQSLFYVKTSLPVLIRRSTNSSSQEFIAAKKTLDGQLPKIQGILGVTDILLVSPDGVVVYASNQQHYMDEFGRRLPEYAREPFMEGKKRIYLSDLFRNKEKGNRIEMIAAAPVVGLDGVHLGIAMFEVDMESVYALIRDKTGLGQTGETLVGKKVGGEVLYLTALKSDRQAALQKRIKIGSDVAVPIQKAVQGLSGEGESIDYLGNKVVAAWRYIPSLDWGMVVKIDSTEAFADVLGLKRLVLLILGIVALLGGVMAYSLARSISDPIKKLSEGADLVGAGHLDHKVALPLKDEVGQLSRAFDKMTTDLKRVMASRDELDREIAERKRTEVALRELTQRLTYHVDNSPLAVIEWGPDMCLTRWSGAAERIFGWKSEEVLGKRMEEFRWIYQGDQAKVEEVSGDLQTGTNPRRFSANRNYRKDGSVAYCEWYNSSLLDESGKLRSILSLVLDVTEQKKAEADIEHSLHRFELLSQTAGELLQSSRPQELVDSLCRKVMEFLDCQVFFNFLVDEQAGRLHLNAFNGIPEEEFRRIEWLDYGVAVCGCVARDGSRIVAEHIPSTPDPRTDLVRSYGIKAYACHPLLGKGGKVVGTLSFGTRNRETFTEEDLSLMKAVTDQVSMAMIRIRDEQELQQHQLDAARALVVKTERQRLYAVLETLPVYVILLTPDYHISFANKFFRDRFSEDHGRCCYNYLFNRTTPCENCETYKVLKSNAPHHWRWIGPDGRNYDVHDFPFRETDGTIHIMEMGIDVTDRIQAQEALLQAQRDMDRAKRLSDIGTLAATVAHELRNPLAAISMATENIRRKAENPNLEKHLFNIALKVAESDQIINNLLFYSRLKPPQYEMVHISPIIHECVEVAEQHSRKQIAFTINVDNVVIKADSLQMKELFNNILHNACDAVPQEGGMIEIAYQEKDGFLKVMVKDNGHGMDQESLKKVFDPFFTTKAKGTGLGLSVCQQIATFHGGTIWIESEQGKGTTVIVCLPHGNGTTS